jgi:hypothetical protein
MVAYIRKFAVEEKCDPYAFRKFHPGSNTPVAMRGSLDRQAGPNQGCSPEKPGEPEDPGKQARQACKSA